MNNILLSRLVNLVRSIPRESLPLAHAIFKENRAFEDVIVDLDKKGATEIAFLKIADLLKVSQDQFGDMFLALRSSVLTKDRQEVHQPKAVCTLPSASQIGVEETLAESLCLIKSAEHSISIMNYWMTSGSEKLIRAVMEQMRTRPSLRVVIVGDSRENFLKPLERMWNPDVRRPAIFIYKPGMNIESDNRSKMHAKTLVIDEIKMLITSANMTGAAMTENIEVGISIEAPRAVGQVAQMINSLIHRTDLFERIV